MADTTNLGLALNAILGAGPRARNALRAALTKLDAAAGKVLTGSKTFDFPSVAAAAETTTTVTVTGAALGDFVVGVALGVSAGGLALSGYVSAANTVTVVARNNTGAAIDLASTTLSVRVRKA